MALFDVSINDEPSIPIISSIAYNISDGFKLTISIPGEYRITGLDEKAIVSEHNNTVVVVIASDGARVSSVSRSKMVSVTLPIKPELLYCDPVARLVLFQSILIL